VRKEGHDDPLARLLPFLNAMHERYDFTWEREWRVQGPVDFTPKDLVAAILPRQGAEKWRDYFARRAVPVISPGLSYEEIVAEMALQQRVTRTWAKKAQHKIKEKVAADE
jgi:hypothetical protein